MNIFLSRYGTTMDELSTVANLIMKEIIYYNLHSLVIFYPIYRNTYIFPVSTLYFSHKDGQSDHKISIAVSKLCNLHNKSSFYNLPRLLVLENICIKIIPDHKYFTS